MTDDIVTRLRNRCRCGEGEFYYKPCLDEEIADEIERLEADRDRWRKIAQGEHYAWSQCAYGCDCLVDIYEWVVRGD